MPFDFDDDTLLEEQGGSIGAASADILYPLNAVRNVGWRKEAKSIVGQWLGAHAVAPSQTWTDVAQEVAYKLREFDPDKADPHKLPRQQFRAYLRSLLSSTAIDAVEQLQLGAKTSRKADKNPNVRYAVLSDRLEPTGKRGRTPRSSAPLSPTGHDAALRQEYLRRQG